MSWIVTRNSTGEAVLETFSKRVADAINTKVYTVHTAYDYLCALNQRIKANNSLRSQGIDIAPTAPPVV